MKLIKNFPLKIFIRTFCGLCLLFSVVPLIMPLIITMWIYSTIVNIYCKCVYGGSIKKVKNLDGLWMENQFTCPNIIIALTQKGEPNIEKVRKHVYSNVIMAQNADGTFKYPKFQHCLSCLHGYYYWRPVHSIDINSHVKMVYLSGMSEKGKESSFQENFWKFLSKIDSDERQLDKPPWEVFVIPKDSESYVLAIRIHHAIGDGVTLIKLMSLALIDDPIKPPPIGISHTSIFLYISYLLSFASMPPVAWKYLSRSEKNPLHEVKKPLSGKKIILATRMLKFSTFKEIKTVASTTINDVFLSCISAAFAKHFAKKASKAPRATLFVPVVYQTLTKSNDALHNTFLPVPVRLPVQHTVPSLKRLKTVKNIFDNVKKDPTLLSVKWLICTVCYLFPVGFAKYILTSKGMTAAVTNVPGPQTEISIFGDTVQEMIFWIPHRSPLGVGFSLISYQNDVQIGVCIDESLVEDREEAKSIVRYFEEEITNLLNELA